jgi:colanic acid biosynthesis glycosyl transferase WcaI
VVTSRLVYGGAEMLRARELVAGVEVTRVPTSRFGNANLAGRAVDYLTFYVSAFFALVRLLRAGDVAVAKTDPPLISVVVAWAAAMKGARLVNWLQDVYPEIASAYGVAAVRGPLGALLSRLRNASLRAARLNVAICDDMARLLAPVNGVRAVEVIHNWSDDAAVTPLPKAENRLRRNWGLMERFVVGYSGNLGRAHDWRTIVDAAEHLRDRRDVLFLMIGGGAGLKALRAAVERRGLQASFRFEPYQPKALLNQSLGAPDVHLISLLPRFRGLLFPSKLFGIAAAGRGVIAITDTRSELADILRDRGCGEAVAEGDALGLAQLITRLAGEPQVVDAYGRRAREMLDGGYRLEQALARWTRALAGVAANAPREGPG